MIQTLHLRPVLFRLLQPHHLLLGILQAEVRVGDNNAMQAQGDIMTIEEYISYAMHEFRKNPYWEEVYQKAPTDISFMYIECNFALSWAGFHPSEDGDRYEARLTKAMDDLQDSFGLEDWKYLRSWCGNNPLQSKCNQKIREIEEKQKAAKRFEAQELELDDQAKEGFRKLKELINRKQAAEAADDT